jgi:hypothetical protein
MILNGAVFWIFHNKTQPSKQTTNVAFGRYTITDAAYAYRYDDYTLYTHTDAGIFRGATTALGRHATIHSVSGIRWDASAQCRDSTRFLLFDRWSDLHIRTGRLSKVS